MTSGSSYTVIVVGAGNAPVAFDVKETLAQSTSTPAHTSGDDPSILNGDTRKCEIGVTEATDTFLVCRTVYGFEKDADGKIKSTKTMTYTKVDGLAGARSAMDSTKAEEAACLFQMKDLPDYAGLTPTEI